MKQILVTKLDNTPLYTSPELQQKLVDFLSSTPYRFVVPHVGKCLFPVWPGSMNILVRLFKSLFGVYKTFGAIGFYVPKLRKTFLIMSHLASTIRFKIDRTLLCVLAHEYQHAAYYQVDSIFNSMIELECQWYIRFCHYNGVKIDSTTESYIRQKLVPTLNLIRNNKLTKTMLLHAWQPLMKQSKAIKQAVEFSLMFKHYNDYLHCLYVPALKAYLDLVGRAPFVRMLKYIMFYQEMYNPSEIWAVVADTMPFNSKIMSHCKQVTCE